MFRELDICLTKLRNVSKEQDENTLQTRVRLMLSNCALDTVGCVLHHCPIRDWLLGATEQHWRERASSVNQMTQSEREELLMHGEGWRCWSSATRLQAMLNERDSVWELRAFHCTDEDCTENVPAGNRCSRQRCGCTCHHVVTSDNADSIITNSSLSENPISHPLVKQLMQMPRDQRPLMNTVLYEHYGAIRRARGLLMGELFRLRDRSNWDVHCAAIETAHVSEMASTETAEQVYHGAIDGEHGVEVPPASVIAQGPRLAGYTLKVPMYIYNNKEVLAMLDTGADTCLVSKSTLTKSSLAHMREMQHRMIDPSFPS